MVNDELILQAQKGNKEAFRSVFSMYKKTVYTTAYLILKDCQHAEDIVQETFLQVYIKISKLSSPLAFERWLYKIAVNLSLEAIRKLKKYETLSLEEYIELYNKADTVEPTTPEDIVINRHFQKKLLQCVYSLPPQYAAVLILFYYIDLSIKEIAEIVNCSESNVKTRLHRARKSLETLLDSDVGSIFADLSGGLYEYR